MVSEASLTASILLLIDLTCNCIGLCGVVKRLPAMVVCWLLVWIVKIVGLFVTMIVISIYNGVSENLGKFIFD